MRLEVKCFIIEGGKNPYPRSDGAAGYDLNIRAVVSMGMDPFIPHMRDTLFDFVSTQTNRTIAKYVETKPVNRPDRGIMNEPVYVLPPTESVSLGLGVVFEIPKGWAGYVEPRGSTINPLNLEVLNDSVPIDSDFRAEIWAEIRNNGNKPVDIYRHMRLVQVVFKPVFTGRLKLSDQVEELSHTYRGNGCHGSTGQC